METLKNLYNLVKAFWIDFFKEAKRGTLKHKKGIKVLLIFCTVVFFVLSVALLKFSETSTFCGACHQMGAYIDSWKASSHRHVACTQCHYEPGFWNHLKGKWVDGQVSLAYFISGKKPSRPHAEISDSACLQQGCHKTEDLKKNMIYKNVAFSHGKHLEELRRGMKLRCTSCHAQIVQGAHLTVHEINCFICHYYKAGPKGEEDCVSCAVGGCTSCHIAPKAISMSKAGILITGSISREGLRAKSVISASFREMPMCRRENALNAITNLRFWSPNIPLNLSTKNM